MPLEGISGISPTHHRLKGRKVLIHLKDFPLKRELQGALLDRVS
jgi:hypothetical protein